MHHDQDTVYTSYDWLQALLIRDRARVSFAEHGARGNPWIESLWGHFKVENGSLLSEAATLEELEWVIDRQLLYYNSERRHSGLDYRAPVEYLAEAGIHPRVLVETGPPSGSATGAQVQVIADGVHGFLVEPEDTEALARALTRVLGDDRLRERLRRYRLWALEISRGTTSPSER